MPENADELRDAVNAALKRSRMSVRVLHEHIGGNRETLTRALKKGESLTEERVALLRKALALLGKDAAAGVPVFGEIPAGNPLDVEDAVASGYVQANGLSSTEHFALIAKGDSMAPEIASGDTVILCKENITLPVKGDGPTPFAAVAHLDGRICACCINGQVTLKRIRLTRTDKDYTLVLSPSNPAHPPITLGACDELRIQGALCLLLRKY